MTKSVLQRRHYICDCIRMGFMAIGDLKMEKFSAKRRNIPFFPVFWAKFEKSLFWAYFASKRSKISPGGLDRSVLVYRFRQKKNFLKISIFGRFRSNLPNLAQFLKNQEKCYKIAKMTFFRNLKVLFEAP